MSTSLFVALRYFGDNTFLGLLKGKPVNFIQLLTAITVFVIFFVTAVLVILLSVFNGLEGFTRELYSSYTPQIKVSPIKGKSFECSESILAQIKSDEGIFAVTRVIQDQALLKYGGEGPNVITLKGLDTNYAEQYGFDSAIVSGSADLFGADGEARAVIGRGVQYNMALDLKNQFVGLQIWYPKNDAKASLDPTRSFRKLFITPGGVFQIKDDNFNYRYVLTPLEFARELTGYSSSEVTALEIKLSEGASPSAVKARVGQLMGSHVVVEDSDEQHKTLLRAIKIERFFVFMGASLVIAIASFNIFFSLAMMAIDKKQDIGLFFALGTNQAFVRKVFMWVGALIGLAGTISGLVAGWIICYLQDLYGFAKLATQSTYTVPYPIDMDWMDFVLTASVVISISVLASIYPAFNASKGQSIVRP